LRGQGPGPSTSRRRRRKRSVRGIGPRAAVIIGHTAAGARRRVSPHPPPHTRRAPESGGDPCAGGVDKRGTGVGGQPATVTQTRKTASPRRDGLRPVHGETQSGSSTSLRGEVKLWAGCLAAEGGSPYPLGWDKAHAASIQAAAWAHRPARRAHTHTHIRTKGGRGSTRETRGTVAAGERGEER